ncbi:hypothetical protein NM2004032_2123 [Neisseria meningitidis 2004032]|nr:hypothetical protein NM2004032_2123 [Neisseria meningitidis 2004032]
MQINPADVFGRKTCVLQCRLKGKDCALRVGAGRGNMVGIAVGSVADEFGVNFRTAPFGVFQFFQHENPRAFADDQPVAVRVVWARGFFRFAVAAAGGIKRVENIHFGREKFFASARQHHIGQTVFDGFVGITYALAAGRTRARCRDDASFQPEKDADIGGGGVRHHTHIGVGTEVARHAGQQQFAYIADVFGAAAGRAAGNAHASVSNAFVSEQTGIRQSLLRRIDAQIRHTPHTSELLARPMFRRRVILNRRTQLRFQFGETFVPIHYIFARRVLPDSKSSQCR